MLLCVEQTHIRIGNPRDDFNDAKNETRVLPRRGGERSRDIAGNIHPISRNEIEPGLRDGAVRPVTVPDTEF